MFPDGFCSVALFEGGGAQVVPDTVSMAYPCQEGTFGHVWLAAEIWFVVGHSSSWNAYGPRPVKCWCRECCGAKHVMHPVWMAYPNQAGSLQGSQHVSADNLAVKYLGIGSGWQQSKQNWDLPAVVGL